jgi:hypothetical protein
MSQIPAFLIAMSQQMHEQSNRMTAEPIFQVRYKHYLVTAPDYNEHHWEIIEPGDGGTLYHSEECNKTNLAEWLLDSETKPFLMMLILILVVFMIFTMRF